MVVEIPKWSRKKFEVATTERLNPIKQDVKDGCPREYFWGDMLFNYGMLPQTYEHPGHGDPHGDNDPLDVVEIGFKRFLTGAVVRVKVLGVLGLIDDEETDWKVLAVAVDDPLVDRLHGMESLEEVMPGAVSALKLWLGEYKVKKGADGREAGRNKFVADSHRSEGRDFALRVLSETHGQYKAEVARQGGGGAA